MLYNSHTVKGWLKKSESVQERKWVIERERERERERVTVTSKNNAREYEEEED